MRTVRAILSILILAVCSVSPAHSEGIWHTDSAGCRVIKRATQLSPGYSYGWSGACKNGYGEGAGTLTKYLNGHVMSTATGVLVHGAWQGKVVAQERQGEAQEYFYVDGELSNKAAPAGASPESKVASSPGSGNVPPKAAAAPGSATRTASTPAAASSKERSTASANCPVETTISSPSHGAITLKFAALREKMLPKAELDAYFQDLVALQREASTNVQNNGLRIYSAYGMTDTPRQRALLGCEGNSGGACADLVINREPPNFADTITPRLKVYQCHRDAGWPSASDSASPRGKTPISTTAAPAGARPQAPAQENDHAPYISGKCVRIVQSGKGVSDAYKRIQNDCAKPVAVTFCLEAPGPINQCLNPLRYGLSDVIPAKKSQLTADAIQGPWTAWFFVCDMSNPKKHRCLVPKDIAGAGAFRD